MNAIVRILLLLLNLFKMTKNIYDKLSILEKEFLISFRFVLTESIWKGIRLSDSCDRFRFKILLSIKTYIETKVSFRKSI